MKKYLAVLLLPVLLSTTKVDSTEIDFYLSNQANYQLNYRQYDAHFTQVPANPNVFTTMDTYIDSNLTQKKGTVAPNEAFEIIGSQVNDQNQVVFELANHCFVLADSSVIYDDVVLESTINEQKMWLKKGFIVYSSPIGNKRKAIKTTLQAYQPVMIAEVVRTHTGEFAKVDGLGWIDISYIAIEDNRIEAVQELLNQKYTSENIGIFVKQLATQKIAGVHQDKMMYAASVSKLPVLYYTQERINVGDFKLTEGLQYVDKVTGFKGSYSAEGSGSLSKIADNRHYRIDELIDKIAKESDNAASNVLAYYMTNQFDSSFYQTISKIGGRHWDMSSRQASAQMAGLMMEAIYYQNGYVLNSLQSTNFDNQRIARDIPVVVAHKIGDAYDFKHDVGLVFSESPFVLSIFTDHSDYDMISQIANDIYGILK
ncbi:serine hydrolase [Streptococcus ovis]|uniref:serine hydrolase n=1 Tax=Streptococcus ovis TaxID=82806 RepID=UPI0003631814|nr:serine hydrolase [Streptococcus ovis]